MACKCIDRLREPLAAHRIQLTLRMTVDGVIERMLVATQLTTKARGRKPLPLIAEYCPMCGKKYPEKK